VKSRQLDLPAHNGLVERSAVNGAARSDLVSRLDTKALLSPPRSLLGHGNGQPDFRRLKMVFLGPSDQTKATIFGGLIRDLSARGHDAGFLERERNLPVDGESKQWPFGRKQHYAGLKELKERFAGEIREADLIVVSSHLDEGTEIAEWVVRRARGAAAFYDLAAPATMTKFAGGNGSSISPALARRFDLYLSLVGGPFLDYMEKHWGARMARPLYCSVDARQFFPERQEAKWDLGYLGDYCEERQPALERLLIEPARRWEDGIFMVAGSGYPRSARWPKNVKRRPDVPERRHREFYNSQRFALNLTPPNSIAAGFSPNLRMFEAAACGTPVITEFWPGLETFFKPDDEILISHTADETMIYLEEISELQRRRIGYRARECVLAKHTTRHRAFELEKYALEVLKLAAV